MAIEVASMFNSYSYLEKKIAQMIIFIVSAIHMVE